MSISNAATFPRVDDHLVRPETREELVRSRLMLKPPATAPHAARHAMVNYVTRGAIAPGYIGAAGLLTRVGPDSDFGTDTCLRREGIDPTTGTRYLEELVLEIVHDEPLDDVTERAELLEARATTLATSIVAVCEVLEIPLDTHRLSHVESLDVAGLETLLTTLRTERRWP
jgi:hypothetical protein